MTSTAENPNRVFVLTPKFSKNAPVGAEETRDTIIPSVFAAPRYDLFDYQGICS
ncbi:hypothetical protein [Thalassospira sp.]|uniref:hypothetical protein n=1 Tax=Thalassospira sp. TaxID=1912094 RepID=UPI00311D3DFD